jgi:ElaB/YqjD/DUF883 family membrane-anchored ribosome-binding protein
MATDSLNQAADDVGKAANSGQKALNDALAAAEKRITDAARSAERSLREGAEALRAQSRVYAQNAGEQFDEAQRYVVERIRERPVTAAMAGLGVGLLLGLLFSNRNR